MILTIVVFLGVVAITCFIGNAVIPRFDRRPAVRPAGERRGDGTVAAAPGGA